VLDVQAERHQGQQPEDDGEENRYDLVLLPEVRIGAFADGGRDLGHLLGAFVLFHDALVEVEGHDQGEDRSAERKVPRARQGLGVNLGSAADRRGRLAAEDVRGDQSHKDEQ